MSEWKVYEFSREEVRYGHMVIIARNRDEARDIGTSWIDDSDMGDADYSDTVYELTFDQLDEYGYERPYRPDDAPDEWDELNLKQIFEWLKEKQKRKMIPGTDEYQEYWESLGQQRMFNEPSKV